MVEVKIIGHIGHYTNASPGQPRKLVRPGETFKTTQGHAELLMKRFPGMYEIVDEKSETKFTPSIPAKKEVTNG